jgi:TRAP-type C4-dicarboxylate transport system permease small subunit
MPGELMEKLERFPQFFAGIILCIINIILSWRIQMRIVLDPLSSRNWALLTAQLTGLCVKRNLFLQGD